MKTSILSTLFVGTAAMLFFGLQAPTPAKADGAATALIFGGGACEETKSKGAPKRTDVTKRQSPDVPRCVTCTVGQSDRLWVAAEKGTQKCR